MNSGSDLGAEAVAINTGPLIALAKIDLLETALLETSDRATIDPTPKASLRETPPLPPLCRGIRLDSAKTAGSPVPTQGASYKLRSLPTGPLRLGHSR